MACKIGQFIELQITEQSQRPQNKVSIYLKGKLIILPSLSHFKIMYNIHCISSNFGSSLTYVYEKNGAPMMIMLIFSFVCSVDFAEPYDSEVRKNSLSLWHSFFSCGTVFFLWHSFNFGCFIRLIYGLAQKHFDWMYQFA